MSDDQVAESARALSERGASKGGRARAKKLSPEARRESARHAAESRWGRKYEHATHVGTLQIGDRQISCAVLEGGTRVINQSTLLQALGRNPKPATVAGVRWFFAANLTQFVPPDLAEGLKEPIAYLMPAGGRAVGYKAELLPLVCEVYLDARSEGKVLKSQERAVQAAEILLRGLARVGVVALIDEATGYQEVRARRELQKILEMYVAAEMRPWVKTFPDEFFREIYRLQGWEYKPGTSKRTPFVGHLVNKYVYKQLPEGVPEELASRNPRNEHGNRTHRHHQFLTADTGNLHLDRQISTVTTLMRISDDKHQFEQLFERAFPPPQQRLPLVIDIDDIPKASEASGAS